MSKRVQWIRHSTGSANAFTGLQGEMTIDTTAKELRVHDGLTSGGIPVARKDLANVSAATSTLAGKMAAADKAKLNLITVTQTVDLDSIETDVALAQSDIIAVETKTDFITVTQAVNLDTVETNSAASKTVTDFISVTQAVNLDTIETATVNNANAISTLDTDLNTAESKLNDIEDNATRDQSAEEIQNAAFPSGTLMLFQQSSAPTGWTKKTTHNNKSLRVVSGTVGSGGIHTFSSVFGKAYTDNHTLTVAQMPAHTHNYNSTQTGGGQAGGWNGSDAHDGSNNYTTTSAGSNNGHSHIMDIRVQYVDLIIAEKD